MDAAKRASESEALKATLASDEAALKATGDSGAKAQAAAAELEKTRRELDNAYAQLAQAQRNTEAAKTEASAQTAALEQSKGCLLYTSRCV